MTNTEWTDEYEYPDPNDDEPEFISCPNCGVDVYEESEQCPACGNWIIADHRIWTGRPIWWSVLGLLGIVAVIYMLSMGR